MKIKTNILFVFFLFLSFSIFAQLSQDTRKKLPTAEQYKKMTKYQTTLNLHNIPSIKGLLFKVTDEQVILIPNNGKVKDYSHFVMLVKKEQIPINIPLIHRIGTRKKGKLVQGLLIGAGLGLVLGISAISSADGNSLLTGNVVTIPILTGGALGLLIGSFSKSHNLNNKAELEKLKGMGIISDF